MEPHDLKHDDLQHVGLWHDDDWTGVNISFWNMCIFIYLLVGVDYHRARLLGTYNGKKAYSLKEENLPFLYQSKSIYMALQLQVL